MTVTGGKVEAADTDSLRLRTGASLDSEFVSDAGSGMAELVHFQACQMNKPGSWL
ncbi:hypothetical protein HCU01_00100 [Halomonas cupida]|uniref:Uncharacterized protein n=1 Tax=Halomonas cupida TaxID=44933 RepID=A0ABQ0W8H8_9GAMM|nr:hypothetical protein HCU01_00100 [Halomonas cupida]